MTDCRQQLQQLIDPDVNLTNTGNPENSGQPGNSIAPASPSTGGVANMHMTQMPPSGSASTDAMLFNASADRGTH